MSELTFVRPEGDSVELALSTWAQLLLAGTGGKAGLVLTDLRGMQVTRASVASAASRSHLVLFFLHGQRNALGDPTALIDATNVACLNGVLAIAFSCLAGDQLGSDAVANGARAFLGFDDVLTNYHPQPALFGHYVQTSVQPLILNGHSIGAVRSALYSSFRHIEWHYSTGPGKSHANATLIWMAAHINWRGLVLHGDQHATL